MKKLSFVAMWLLLASACFAGDLKIVGETKVGPNKLVKLSAEGMDPKAGLIWRISPRDNDKADTIKTKLQFVGVPGTTYTVDLLAVRLTPDGSTEIDEVSVSVTIAGKAPPGPDQPPNPDQPKPPIPGVGLRVLVVYETADLPKLSPGQMSAIYSQTIRDYLRTHCAVGPGNVAECRYFDKDVDLTSEFVTWREAMARPRTSLPWLIVSNGVTGYEGPLPATADATLELLKKFGGP